MLLDYSVIPNGDVYFCDFNWAAWTATWVYEVAFLISAAISAISISFFD
jgi:hypothetical protein